MRKSNCPILISWHESEVVPLHIIAREILRCGSDDIRSDKIYYVDYDNSEGRSYNIVIGARDIEEVVDMYIENNVWDGDDPPLYPELGGFHPNDIKEIRNSITLWEDKFKLDKYYK